LKNTPDWSFGGKKWAFEEIAYSPPR